MKYDVFVRLFDSDLDTVTVEAESATDAALLVVMGKIDTRQVREICVGESRFQD